MVVPNHIPTWQLQSNFLVAITYGDLKACSTLLAAGADCDQLFRSNTLYRPALSFAVFASLSQPTGYKVVELLLNSGSSVNLPDSNGATCLHAAAQIGSEETCRLLVERGANLNAVDNDGVSPLHLAVQRSSYSITKLLLDNGADVNRLDNSQKSALHHACGAPLVSQELVKLLVSSGAILDEIDARGFTPFASLLQSSKYSYSTVRTFIEKGVRLNSTCNGKAPIHRIVQSHSPDRIRCLELLLSSSSVDIDIDARTHKKQTALHLSVFMNDVECARTLLCANADPNTVDRLGISPLALAITLGYTELIDLLLKAGVRGLVSAAKLDMKLLPKEYRQELLKRIAETPKLMEIARRAVWSRESDLCRRMGSKPLNSTSSAPQITQITPKEAIKGLGTSGQVPLTIVPFLLLED